jgi:DNA-binding LacI/PurR family transcriptional regulator
MSQHIAEGNGMLRKKATLKSIADHVGVSTATVSNAFNRPTQLSKTLRDSILEESKKLGYSGPSMAARSLRTGKTGVIGVLLADNLAYNFVDPVASQFLAGVATTLDDMHVNLLLLPTNRENYINTQVHTIPDSFIIYGKPRDNNVLQLILEQQKPVVTVDFTIPNLPTIYINNEQAAYEVAKHALRSADDNVLILGLRLEASPALSLANLDRLYSSEESVSRCRFDGYQRALLEMGIDVAHQQVWQLHHIEDMTLNTMLRGALTAPTRADVLLCMSDKIALSALNIARELNLKLPEELRIVGFDGIPAAEAAGLTTIQQPLIEKGQEAAKMALGLLPYQSRELDTKLIARASSYVKLK